MVPPAVMLPTLAFPLTALLPMLPPTVGAADPARLCVVLLTVVDVLLRALFAAPVTVPETCDTEFWLPLTTLPPCWTGAGGRRVLGLEGAGGVGVGVGVEPVGGGGPVTFTGGGVGL